MYSHLLELGIAQLDIKIFLLKLLEQVVEAVEVILRTTPVLAVAVLAPEHGTLLNK